MIHACMRKGLATRWGQWRMPREERETYGTSLGALLGHTTCSTYTLSCNRPAAAPCFSTTPLSPLLLRLLLLLAPVAAARPCRSLLDRSPGCPVLPDTASHRHKAMAQSIRSAYPHVNPRSLNCSCTREHHSVYGRRPHLHPLVAPDLQREAVVGQHGPHVARTGRPRAHHQAVASAVAAAHQRPACHRTTRTKGSHHSCRTQP